MIALFAVLSLAGAPSDLGNPTTLFPPAPRPAGALPEAPSVLNPLRCTAVPTKIDYAAPVGFTRLGDLPDAHSEIAINRTVAGCPAPLIVRYNVSR